MRDLVSRMLLAGSQFRLTDRLTDCLQRYTFSFACHASCTGSELGGVVTLFTRWLLLVEPVLADCVRGRPWQTEWLGGGAEEPPR